MYTFYGWLNEQGYVGIVSGNPFQNQEFQQEAGARSKYVAVSAKPKLARSNASCLYLNKDCEKNYKNIRKVPN